MKFKFVIDPFFLDSWEKATRSRARRRADEDREAHKVARRFKPLRALNGALDGILERQRPFVSALHEVREAVLKHESEACFLRALRGGI